MHTDRSCSSNLVTFVGVFVVVEQQACVQEIIFYFLSAAVQICPLLSVGALQALLESPTPPPRPLVHSHSLLASADF